MPDSPHLTKTYCGYTLMTLTGLAGEITTGQVERITINGVSHKFKPMGDQTLMLIPSFRQEAQTIGIYCKGGDQTPGIHKPVSLNSPPDFSTGFTPASHNRFQKEI
jgi:hypothetical protein